MAARRKKNAVRKQDGYCGRFYLIDRCQETLDTFHATGKHEVIDIIDEIVRNLIKDGEISEVCELDLILIGPTDDCEAAENTIIQEVVFSDIPPTVPSFEIRLSDDECI